MTKTKLKPKTKPSFWSKLASLRNILLLTIILLVGILVYNFSTVSGFFASPASINAVKVSTKKGGGTGGASGAVNLNLKGSAGSTTTKNDDDLNSKVTNKNVDTQSFSQTGGSTGNTTVKKKKTDNDSTNPFANVTGTAGGTSNSIPETIKETVSNVVTTVTQVVNNSTSENGTKGTKSDVKTGSSTNNNPFANVTGTGGGVPGSNSATGNHIQDKCDECKAKLGQDCDTYCKYIPGASSTGGSTGTADVGSTNQNNQPIQPAPQSNNPTTKNCGGGKAPMRVGLWYPTGTAFNNDGSQRACVKINEDCSHSAPQACHTLPANQVVLPAGAGAEYTSGTATAPDGSNVDKTRKKNCYDIGGVPVPHTTSRKLDDGSMQYCNNGNWQATPPVEATSTTQKGSRIPLCHPSCQGNNRSICTAEGKIRLESCGPQATCINNQCEPIPTAVENGKEVYHVTKAICDAFPIVPSYLSPVCMGIKVGETVSVVVNPEETKSLEEPINKSQENNSILADAPGRVNIDTAGTFSGCVGGLAATLIPCSGPLIFGPLGVPASIACRAVACIAGGYAGNKVGDVIYNVTH